MTTYNEALEWYGRAVAAMEATVAEMEQIDAMPDWQRSMFAQRRQRLEKTFEELDAAAQELARKMERALDRFG